MTDRRSILASAVALASCLLSPSLCSAQAWLPARGEGSVSITSQNVNFSGHFNPDGSRDPSFQTRASNLIFDVEYGLTQRLALNANLAYVNVKWTDKVNPPLNLPRNVVDDGTYHGSPQDLRFELRYNPLQRPLVVTPFFAAIIPSHGYEVIGEAAPGRHLREFLAGAYAGRLLNPVLPRAYVHGLYSYAFVERDANVPLNRSNVDVQFGYFVAPSLSLSFLWSRQWTHGGLDFDQIFETPEIFLNHDRLVRSNFQHIGAGASFALSKSVDLHGNVIKFVSGSNTHYGTAITVGVTWRFLSRGEPSVSFSSQVPGRSQLFSPSNFRTP